MHRIFQYFILILVICNHQVRPIAFSAAIKIGGEVFKRLKSALHVYNGDIESAKILNSIEAQSKKLDRLTAHFDRQLDTMSQNLLSDIPKAVVYNNAMAELRRYITRVNELYSFYNIYENSTDYFDDTFINYLDKLVSHNINDLQNTLVLAHELITVNQTSTFVESPIDIFKQLTANSHNLHRCGSTTSLQQHLFYIFAKLITAEVRGCIMTSFAYSVLTKLNGNKYEKVLEIRIKNSMNRLKNYDKLWQNEIRGVNREIQQCPSSNQTRGETYFELERLVQGVIVNTRNMGDVKCKEKCHKVSNNGADVCRGRLKNCEPIGNTYLSVCMSPEGSSRRYEWYKAASGSQWGNDGKCTGKIEEFPAINHASVAFIGSMMTGIHASIIYDRCMYCACMCLRNKADSNGVIRTISLVQQISDIEDNMVVIGIRLVAKNNVVHIQIKQGRLRPFGGIKRGSESWVPLPHINQTNRTFNGSERLHGKLREYKSLQADNAILYLDDLMAPPNHVVIGVSFNSFKNVTPSITIRPFSLSITTCAFNWNTGKLLMDRRKNKLQMNRIDINNNPNDSPDYNRPRTEVKLDNTDNPLKSLINNPDPETNRFVKFTMSDLKKDAGQSTVPFFDSQEVKVRPAFPLGGIGLHWSGYSGYGGFIAPKLFTIDVATFDSVADIHTV